MPSSTYWVPYRAFGRSARLISYLGQKDYHQAPIRNTSEPYSSSGLLHTRVEFGHNCQAIHRACSLLATNTEPLKCSCRTQKSPRLSRILVVVLQFSAGSRWYGRNSRPLASFPNRPRRRRPRSRPFPSGTSETPAACFSLFLLSYVQPCNRPQSVIDHKDDDDEHDYKDEED
jgi:hypothetical protein